MLMIREASGTQSLVTLAVAGKLRDEELTPLRLAVEAARGRGVQVRLDLADVVLLGRAALEYLARSIGPDMQIARCPAYLSRWIACERTGPAADGGTFTDRTGSAIGIPSEQHQGAVERPTASRSNRRGGQA